MNDLQFVCFVILVAAWPVYEMVHEAYEFIVDEYQQWKLKRIYKKWYWFLNWRK